MSHSDEHKKDHDRILKELDCSQDVAGLKVKVALLEEKVKEGRYDKMKMEDGISKEKEKTLKQTMWFGGMLFSIVMAVGASAIQQNATVQVLTEKVNEQKSEIQDMRLYTNDIIDQMNSVIANHKH